jgi:hypothetical protein
MPSGRTIRTLDEVAARLRAGDSAFDRDTAQWVAAQFRPGARPLLRDAVSRLVVAARPDPPLEADDGDLAVPAQPGEQVLRSRARRCGWGMALISGRVATPHSPCGGGSRRRAKS